MKSLIPFSILFLSAITSGTAQSWMPQGHGLLPLGYTILSMSAVDDTVIWLTAGLESVAESGAPVPLDHKLKVLRSVDGGNTWEVHDVATGRFSFDIIAVDANTAWITTQTYGNGISNSLFKTEDGGETWMNKLNHGPAGVFIRRFDDTHLLCQVNDRYSWSDDGGENWIHDTIQEYLPQEFNTLASGNNMASFVGDTLWVGTILGRIVRFTEYGATFQMIYTGTIYVIQSLTFADHLRGMIFHYNESSGAFGLSRTHDGGTTWELTPSKPQTNKLYNITYVPGTSATFVAATEYSQDGAEFFWTTDFGETWVDGGEIKNAHTNCVQFLSPDKGWVSSGTITRTDEPIIYQWSSDIFSGTQQVQKIRKSITVLPNPAIDIIKYTWDGFDHQEHLLTVFNAKGETVVSRYSFQDELDIRFLPEGIYSLMIQSKDFLGNTRFLKIRD
jgi:hypothetical protein